MQLLTFNDDIQGTAAVALGAILGAVKVTGKSLKDQQIVFLGAGSAGIGVADGLRAAMQERAYPSRRRAATSGSLTKTVFCIRGERTSLRSRASMPSRRSRVSGWPRTANGQIGLADVIGKIEATILIGLSTVGGAFTEADCSRNGAQGSAPDHLSAFQSDRQSPKRKPRI